ncbi:MAG: HNH endonuclease [Alphaproteobacteria bacterium]|nr:MAG: HNH endonuclease [Alphaproteobacteria bacterium]
MKIGEFVRSYIEKIFEYCEENPDEFKRLQDKEYSKDIFDINYPFCMKTADISEKDLCRYWKRFSPHPDGEYVVCNIKVRVCSQWFDEYINQSRKLFSQYLFKKKLATKQELAQLKAISIKNERIKVASGKRKNSRYRGNAIGNAQNLAIRNILSNLGSESFNADDWNITKAYFVNQCAYCGSDGNLEMEHAVPINKEKLGEHRLGNIIPSCKPCNKKKHNKNYIEFLGSNTERIKIIEEYMRSRNYVPITKSAEIKQILDQAYRDVGLIAEKYIKTINALDSGGDNET